MPDFDLSVDIYLLAGMWALAMMAGFLLRSRQLAKKKRQIMKIRERGARGECRGAGDAKGLLRAGGEGERRR